jgi:hypothetical protein
MNEKCLSSPLDAALAQVDPERRRFLGMLLAGAAALPLLTSTDLTAEDKPNDLKAHKGSPAIKDGQANAIKLNNQNDKTIKFWDKTSGGSNAHTVKGSTAIKHNSVSPAIKGESPAIKNANTAIKGETKPAPQ